MICVFGCLQQNCDATTDTVLQQPSRSLAHVQYNSTADTVHKCQQTPSYDSNTSARNCSILQQHEESSDEDTDMQSPVDDTTTSDVLSKLVQPADDFSNAQSTRSLRSEPSKRGARSRIKRRRKSETSIKTKQRDSSVDGTPATTPQSGTNSKQKSLRLKSRKRKGDRGVEKGESDAVADGSESDAKPIESASSDVIYTCEDCGKEFPSANVLTRHKRMHSSRIFHCSICSTDFVEPVAFKRHSVVIHEIHRPFTCSHAGCEYRSDRLSNVEKHMSIHSPTHAFACSLCGRTFAQDAGLRSHLLSCMSSRTFLCDLCGSSFNHLQSMQSHQRVHTGERPYRCSDCDSTFADHRNYKRHRRIHDNAFPYACMLCGKHFRHSNSLKSHLGSHGIMTKPIEGSSCTPPLSNQTGGSLGIASKPVVESTSSTPTQPSHSLAHMAF